MAAKGKQFNFLLEIDNEVLSRKIYLPCFRVMTRYRETDLFTNFKPDIVKIEIVKNKGSFKIR